MSNTTSKTTTTAVSKTPIAGGYIETVTKMVRETGPKTRAFFGLWLLGSTLHYGVNSYNHCKKNLMNYRERRDWSREGEFGQAMSGLRDTPFWGSVVWPYTILSEMTPSLVLLLNPVDEEWEKKKLELQNPDGLNGSHGSTSTNDV
jgi:hypothetical protein